MSLTAAAAAAREVHSANPEDENDKNVQQWKIKKLIKSLEAARGYGFIPTSFTCASFLWSSSLDYELCVENP
jgi:hypothetical protein